MAKTKFAFWRQRDGWYQLRTPEPALNAVADFWFEQMYMLRDFAQACGWMLKEGWR